MKTTVFAKKVIDFYLSLQPDFRLPEGFTVMNPYEDAETLAVCRFFYQKYFNDKEKRYFIFGINPGRLGGGITGIPFTDPYQLTSACNIKHNLPVKKELSSFFIYQMIDAYGGPDKFYSKYFLTAVCPIGFMQENRNANYYDNPAFITATRPFILTNMINQEKLGCLRDVCFCLGQGKNLDQLHSVNEELQLFKKIIPLAHPRWVMQYRRKSADQYIGEYLEAFSINTR